MDLSTSSSFHREATTTNNNHNTDTDDLLTPLEQEVLDEYAKLATNLDSLSGLLADLASQPSASILDKLRDLERSTTTVFTLLKASVYSIVLQQEIFGEGEGDGGLTGSTGRGI